jgi:two-component system sensor histidine kinase KdpD
MDYMLIEQALGNLLDNAANYTPVGTTITVAANVEGDDLLISVEDEGTGLTQEDLGLIFDRFYRGAAISRKANGNSTGGVGIGLTLARGFVEAHGGKMWAVNRRGGGLRVSFSLPIHPADMPEAAFAEEGE